MINQFKINLIQFLFFNFHQKMNLNDMYGVCVLSLIVPLISTYFHKDVRAHESFFSLVLYSTGNIDSFLASKKNDEKS